MFLVPFSCIWKWSNFISGILHSKVVKGTLMIDSSTIDPAVSKDMAKAAEGKGALYMDAPVSGGENISPDMLYVSCKVISSCTHKKEFLLNAKIKMWWLRKTKFQNQTRMHTCILCCMCTFFYINKFYYDVWKNTDKFCLLSTVFVCVCFFF